MTPNPYPTLTPDPIGPGRAVQTQQEGIQMTGHPDRESEAADFFRPVDGWERDPRRIPESEVRALLREVDVRGLESRPLTNEES